MASLLLLKSMILTKALRRKDRKKKNRKSNFAPKDGVNKCRICGENKAYISIFNNLLEPHLAEDILNFSGVLITLDDKLSKYMCQGCLDLLNGCILFRDTCQRTNKLLTEAAEELNVKIEYNALDDNSEKGFLSDDDSCNMLSPQFSDSEIWSCSTCMKDFIDLATYNTHLPKCDSKFIHDKDQPQEEITKKKFLCETCGKTATSKASLLVHMSTHDNVFPYKCDVCPYQGRTIDLLKIHKRSHLVDKPFKCTQCPKATTTSSNLSKHMRHVHSTTRPFKCTYCEKYFSYQHDMKRHVKDIHLRQGTVDCDICYKKFNTKKILQGHRWKIHKIKSERSGRLPSYLLCQLEEQNNPAACDTNYS